MIGGRVILLDSDEDIYKIYKNELDLLKNMGNIPYDMLILVPNQMVNTTFEGKRFKYVSDYEKHGIFIWDGTSDELRSTYSPLGEDIRLYQYESSRGLEAWTVVCLEFDQFLENKMQEYSDDKCANSLLLESEEEKRMKYLLNWALVPLTRAIDTLIITLKNKDSKWSKLLYNLQKLCGDYVIYEEK